VKHTTGIPHSATGQSIVERAHRTLKRILEQQHGGVETLPSIETLSKALYIINFLSNSFMEPNPPVVRHFSNTSRPQITEKPPVLVKDPESKQRTGPFPLI
ncbi:POK19 protein, partial [Tichodroma muraria]|nr:POK19 protein [Tichodroma muraria]